jgi:lactose/L-arabinose transport system permease protein
MANTQAIQAAATPVPRRDRLSTERARWGIVFVSPFFILFAIFGLYPLVASLGLSFAEWRGSGAITFNGLNNYALLLRDKNFWQSMRNGVILFFMYAPLQTFLALVLAALLNSRRVRGYRWFRTVIFMPYITNMVAAGFVFQLLLNTRYGVFNNLLAIFFIPPVAWLDTIWGARVALCLLIIWAWLGYHMVIMHAGLQTIPQDLTEAALIDGATPMQAFFRVTIPLMRPLIVFSILLSTIGSFYLLTELFSLFSTTGGTGPLGAVRTPALEIYNQAFSNRRFGYASALAYTFFTFVFIVTVLQYRFFGRQRD